MSRVLILDDEPAVRQALALCVKTSGHVAELTGNPWEAMERLTREDFDLFITDLRLPGVSGLEVVREMRRRRCRIRVILISASLHDVDPLVLKEACISAVLAKPFDFTQFKKVFLPLVAAAAKRPDLDLSTLPSPVDPSA